MLEIDDAPMHDIGDIWDDPYPGTGPVDYARGIPYKPLSAEGFIQGTYGPDTLAEAFRRREGGASLSEVRRDLGLTGDRAVSDTTLERAVDRAGRGILGRLATGEAHEPRRYWGGIASLPTRAEWEAQQRAMGSEGG